MKLSLLWVNHLFYIVTRLGTVLLFTPIKPLRQLPVSIKFILIFSLSLLIVNFIPNHLQDNPVSISLGMISEFANGLILATCVYACFGVFHLAGQLIESEIGLNSLAIFNPLEHQEESVTSHFFSLLSALLFFSLQGHIWLFKGLIYSFNVIPPGSFNLFYHATTVIKQFGVMFSISLMLASPIVLVVLIIELSFAVIARHIPQVSPYFLALPIKIIAGLLTLIFSIDYINPIMSTAITTLFQTWQDLMS